MRKVARVGQPPHEGALPAVTVRVLKDLRHRAHQCARVVFMRARRRSFFMLKKLDIGTRKGSKFGTERTRELLRRLGDPDKKLKIVHVAGSNGKGSVCAYVTAILAAAGLSVGTFTSPAVCSREECFLVGGMPVSRERLLAALALATERAAGIDDAPSDFEMDVCAALVLFADSGCEYCVLECGLGGLYDATNAVSAKQVAVITSVSLEHTDVLGGNILDICRHKAGIIRDCPVIVPAVLPAQAADYFGAFSPIVAGAGLKITEQTAQKLTFEYGGEIYSAAAYGLRQAYNCCIAIECAKLLGIDGANIKRGLARAKLPFRVQTIERNGRVYILDGAHNPEAFMPLLQRLDGTDDHKSLVYTCLCDKNAEECAHILAPRFDEVILFPAPSGRAMALERMERAFSEHGNVRSFKDIRSAMAAASKKYVVVCGSFTHLKEAMDWIEQKR